MLSFWNKSSVFLSGFEFDDDEDFGSDLDEEPGGDQGQAAVLPVEAVVIGIEGEVVQIEEPENTNIHTDSFSDTETNVFFV